MNKIIKYILRFLGLPLLVLWLEIIMHISMSMKFTTIWLFFALSFGAILNVIAHIPASRGKCITISKIIAALISLLYCIEYMARQILAAFYPFSSLKTAAGNHLSSFIGMIIEAIIKNWYWILLYIGPCVLAIIFLKPNNRKLKKKAHISVLLVSLVFAIACHCLGFVSTFISWNKTVSAKELYAHSQNYEDQVEQLGVATMLRLDIQYKILGIKEKETPIDDPVVPVDVDPVDKSKNIIGIDWTKVISSTNNSAIKRLSSYFATVEGTKKNQYTGMLEGHNVIFITMEAVDYYAISEELTPTLYKMMNEGIVLKNFYTALHFASTSGGECQNLLGLYPYNGWHGGEYLTIGRTGALKTNCYFSLAQQLGRLGYNNQAFHDHNYNLYYRKESHTNLGYNYHWIDGSANGLPDTNKGNSSANWLHSDVDMIEPSTQWYLNSDTPFNVYYITISAHANYGYNSWIPQKYKDILDNLNYDSTTLGYLGVCMDTDRAVELLLQKLDEAGELDNTTIVIAPDHIPYTIVDKLSILSGEEWTTQADMSSPNEKLIYDYDVYKNIGIIWDKSIEEPIIVDKVCCQVDLLPTVSNLLGLEYDSRVLAGIDVLSDSEGLVIFQSRSWKSDLGTYFAGTGKFELNDGVTMSSASINSYVTRINNIVKNRLNITYDIIENDFYDYVYTNPDFRLGDEVSSPYTYKEFQIKGLFNGIKAYMKLK